MPRRDYDDDEDRYGRRSRDDADRYHRQNDDDDDYDDDVDDDYDRRRSRYQEPHRGTLILVLGILGLVVCGFCAIAAWIMGAQDLAKMRAGTMDREGFSNTQVGYVLGIVGTILIMVSIAIVIVVLGVLQAGG